MKLLIKILITMAILVALCGFCNAKATRHDARFVRTATEYKKILSFMLTGSTTCNEFSIGDVGGNTVCPVASDTTNIDYYCDTTTNIVHIIAVSAPDSFSATLNGLTADVSCTVGGTFGGNCGLYHSVAKNDEVTCSADYCTPTTEFVTDCQNGGGWKTGRSNFLYFRASGPAPTDPSCKEIDESCCASLCSPSQTGLFDLVVSDDFETTTGTLRRRANMFVVGPSIKISGVRIFGESVGEATVTIKLVAGDPLNAEIPASVLATAVTTPGFSGTCSNFVTLPISPSEVTIVPGVYYLVLQCDNCGGGVEFKMCAKNQAAPFPPFNGVTFVGSLRKTVSAPYAPIAPRALLFYPVFVSA